MNAIRRRPDQAGLTLLEMLVVLMIAAMALALGFQSLGQWRRADAAIAGVTGEVRQARLVEGWLRSSVQGLLAVEDAPFAGAAEQMAGITLAPVMAGPGGNTAIEWRVMPQGGAVLLQLSEHGRTVELPLPDVTAARFVYVDSAGEPHPQWPPALGTADHLPSVVALQVTRVSGGEKLWAAAVRGALNPVYRPYEPEPL